MQSMLSLLKQLETDHPEVNFIPGKEFHWSPDKQVVFYDLSGEPALLLHEVAHATLQHARYQKDVELIALEREAWEYAKEVLSPRYSMVIEEDLVQDALDTYRDWLHARSTCPQCSSAGLQIKKSTYRCVACHSTWQVNEARSCALRRYLVTN